MKKTLPLILLFTILAVKSSLATDLIVSAGGSGNSYATINAALAAAAPNDRIIVYPQAGGSAYSETPITITKSIQILSATEGAYYSVDAPSITISPASAGIKVTIIGMKLFTGSISSGIASPSGARSSINILNDSLAQGAINFNHDNYDLLVSSCHIESGVTCRFGKIIGNIIRSAVTINNDASANNVGDTIQIIGNKISYYNSTTASGLTWTNSSQFFSIQNNYIYLTYPVVGTNYGINVSASKASIAGTNSIVNNTIRKVSGGSMQYYMILSTNATSYTEVINNLCFGDYYYQTIYTIGGTYSVHYNYCIANAGYGFVNDGTNVLYTNTSLNSEGLNTNLSSNTIDGGSTDSAYADIDLTRNDVGCYGGSFTLNNFFPISSNDWARVILVTAPRRVLINGAIPVKAIGFDK